MDVRRDARRLAAHACADAALEPRAGAESAAHLLCRSHGAGVVVPAELTIDSEGGGSCAAWPAGALTLANNSFHGIDAEGCAAANGGRGACAWQGDLSFLGNIPEVNDFFMHIDPSQEPWSAPDPL